MSETVAKKKEAGMLQLVIVLLAISAITALLLGLTNMVTMPYIARNTLLKTQAAMAEVLPADGYEPVEYTGGNLMVSEVNRATNDSGYVVRVAPSGFAGAVDMMVGVSVDGTVTGVSIITQAETPGLGANATKADWRAQFVGKSGTVAVSKDGGEIDALTGATITSRAVTSGVNAALDAVASLDAGPSTAGTSEGTKLEAAMAEAFPTAGYEPVVYTGGDAMVSEVNRATDGSGHVVRVIPSGRDGIIDMVVGVSADGVVTGVSIVSHMETPDVGANATKADWRAQFIGKSGTLAVTQDGGEINALTGATTTSRAVTGGVNAALNAVASLS